MILNEPDGLEDHALAELVALDANPVIVGSQVDAFRAFPNAGEGCEGA